MKSFIALVPSYEPPAMLAVLSEKLSESGFSVVIVDDGSGERYSHIFRSSARFATVLTHDRNMGKGCALKTGLSYIKDNYPDGSVIVTLDSDGQHTVKDARNVCERAMVNEGFLVLGSRRFGKNVPLRSRFGNSMTRFVYRISTGVSVKDTQTGLRAFHKSLIPFMLGIEGDRYEYEMNMLLECARNNIPIIEVGIETIYFDNNSASHFNAITDSYRVYKEIIKFAASSVTGFLVDYIMYSLLILLTGGLGTSISVPLSNIVARIISANVNYSINRRYVFKNKDSIVKTASQYFILAACILIGNTFFLSFLVEVLMIDKFIAKIITEITFFTLSWLAQRYIIFRRMTATEAGGRK